MITRKIYYFILLTLVLAGCGTASDRFRVEGRLLHMDQGEFYVYSLNGAINGIDTVRLQNGRFTYEMSCQAPTTLVMVFPNFSEQPIFAEPGKTVHMEGDASHLKQLTVKGTDDNKLMNSFREQVATVAPPRAAALAEQFIKDHPASVVSTYLVRRYFIASATPDYTRALRLISLMRREQPKNGTLVNYEQQLKSLSKVIVGKPMPKFSTTDVTGQRVDNSTLGRGLAVINVYATWNYDSQRQMADLRQLMHRAGGKLRVVSFSIDPNPRQCRALALRDTITWPTVCDGRLLDSPVLHGLSLYDIPDNILIQNGRVVAKGLRSDELKQRIERML